MVTNTPNARLQSILSGVKRLQELLADDLETPCGPESDSDQSLMAQVGYRLEEADEAVWGLIETLEAGN